MKRHYHQLFLSCAIVVILVACSKETPQEEQLTVQAQSLDAEPSIDTANSVRENAPNGQFYTFPNRVVLTGLPRHRLVAVYKSLRKKAQTRYSYTSDYWEADEYSHFMPGLDLFFGYNLVKLSHYDMELEKLNDLFEKPVLVKSLYYPSWIQDSVGEKPNRKPITRDYFLVSVYDEDTNADTLLNRHDLRRLYHFDAGCSKKTLLVPRDYSVTRSQYDLGNDAMFIYAVHDSNGNGKTDEREPTHVFWISLKMPMPAKRLY